MIEIRPAKESEHDKILALGDESFGKGYLTNRIVDFKRMTVLLVDGVLAGFVNTDLYDDEEFDVIEGMIETLAVSSKYQRKGFGSILIAAALATLMLENAKKVYCYAAIWSDSEFAPAAKPLEKNGFTVSENLSEPWKHDPPTYECRACGHPCCCNAVLYVWSSS